MRKMKITLLGIAALSIVFCVTAIVRADEYADIIVKGNEMAPLIHDGDTLRVKICRNGMDISTGSLWTGDSPGDIIVYCSIATGLEPQSMWMCGRAISKYYDGKNWIIQTQMDTKMKPDPWEVPEYYLLGVVWKITHSSPTQQSTSTSQPSEQTIISSGFNLPDLSPLVDFAIGMAVGLAITLAGTRKQIT